MFKTTLALSLGCILLAGCSSSYSPQSSYTPPPTPYSLSVANQDSVQRQALALQGKYRTLYPKLILKVVKGTVLVGGEVGSKQELQTVAAEVRAIPYAMTYVFPLVRKDSSPKQVKRDAELTKQVQQIAGKYSYYVESYVVDGRVGVIGPVGASKMEDFRYSFLAFEDKVPGVQPDPYLVVVAQTDGIAMTFDDAQEMGDWAPKGIQIIHEYPPNRLSGTEPDGTAPLAKPVVIAQVSHEEEEEPAATAPQPASSNYAAEESDSATETVKVVGGLLGVALGSKVTYDTGNMAQGQQVMQAAFNAVGLNSSSSSSGGSSSGYGNPVANGPQEGDPSPRVLEAEAKKFNFGGHCPADTSGVRSEITYPDLLNDSSLFNVSILGMAKEQGDYDLAIAFASAQKEQYLQRAKEAAQGASDSWGAMNPLYDVRACPQAEGIYCTSVHGMWSMSDMAIHTEYIKDALECHKAAGTEL